MNEIISGISKNPEEQSSSLNPSRFLLNLQGENRGTLLEEVFSILGRSNSSLKQMHQLTLQSHFSLLLLIEIEEDNLGSLKIELEKLDSVKAEFQKIPGSSEIILNILLRPRLLTLSAAFEIEHHRLFLSFCSSQSKS